MDFTNSVMLMRIVIFLAHAITAITLLLKVANSFQNDCQATVTYSSLQTTLQPFSTVHYQLNVEHISNETLCNHSDWCGVTRIPDQMDTVYDGGSHVLGSSWNLLVVMLVFEWIAASYTLFYIDPFDSWPSSNLWWGYHPIIMVCTAWNLFLFVYLWAARSTIHLPVNNLFIYMICLAKTMVIQNVLSISSPKQETTTEVAITNPSVYSSMQWQTDHFLRNRKRNDAKMGWTVFHTDAPFHQQHYVRTLESTSMGLIPRFMEYSVTAPLLLLSLFINAAAFSESWKHQYMLMALFVSGQICIPFHVSILRIVKDQAAKYRSIAIYFFAAGWTCLVMTLYVLIYSCQDILIENTADSPGWIVALVWFMMVSYVMLSVIMSRYYIPVMLFVDGDKYEESWQWLSVYLDIGSLLTKLPIAWTIYIKGAIVYCAVVSSAVC